MSTPAQFYTSMKALPLEIEKATGRGVAKAALELTAAARRNIAVASGGDSRLSGVGPRGARVGARYKVTERGFGGDYSALVTADGPVQLIERDTDPHDEFSRSVSRAKGRSRLARSEAAARFYNALFGGDSAFAGTSPMSTPYGPRYRVNHPGTKGKHPFKRAVAEVAPHAPRIFQEQVHDALHRVFR